MKQENYEIRTYNLECWRYYYLYIYATKFRSHTAMVPDISDPSKSYDLFISYANQDKDEIASPLATALDADGLSVWFYDFEIHIGDNLERKINQGIIQSQFAVVIISPSYIINERWARYEWGKIQQRNEIKILPVWHRIDENDLRYSYRYSELTKYHAIKTSDHSIDEIAEKIVRKVRKQKYGRSDS